VTFRLICYTLVFQPGNDRKFTLALTLFPRWRGNHVSFKGCSNTLKGKRIGLITVYGDPVHTADPIVHSFKSTVKMTKMYWLGAVMTSAGDKGDILKDEKTREKALELGKKAATP
jgi:hypothetical protein